jgi:hypothetical protein
MCNKKCLLMPFLSTAQSTALVQTETKPKPDRATLPHRSLSQTQEVVAHRQFFIRNLTQKQKELFDWHLDVYC